MWKRLCIKKSYNKETKHIPTNFNENKATFLANLTSQNKQSFKAKSEFKFMTTYLIHKQ